MQRFMHDRESVPGTCSNQRVVLLGAREKLSQHLVDVRSTKEMPIPAVNVAL